MKKTKWRTTEGGRMRMSEPAILGYNTKSGMPIGQMSVPGTTPRGNMSKERMSKERKPVKSKKK